MTKIIIQDAFYAIGNPFSDSWEGWTKITFPSLSIDPRIKTCETMPAIFLLSGICYYNQGNIEFAINQIREAIKLNSNFDNVDTMVLELDVIFKSFEKIMSDFNDKLAFAKPVALIVTVLSVTTACIPEPPANVNVSAVL